VEIAKTAGERKAEAISIVEDVLKTETPGRRGAKYIFAGIVYRYFNEIQSLHTDGFTLASVCKVFERRGELPENSDPCGFRKAYRKELSRRKTAAKFNDAANAGQKASGVEAKNGKIAEPSKIPSPRAPQTSETSGGEYEKERLKELTGTLVDTGTGIIRKFPNGSFEF
jgi:hypothetical protein